MTCRHPNRVIVRDSAMTRTHHRAMFFCYCADCLAPLDEIGVDSFRSQSTEELTRVLHPWADWQHEQARRASLPPPYRSEIPRHGGEGDP